MKKGLSLLCSITILFGAAPLSFASQYTRGSCSTLTGLARSGCERRQARVTNTPDANRLNILPQRRRADSGGISTGRVQSIEQLRQDSLEDLRRRRVQAQSNYQHRYDERRSRLEEQREQRINELRIRYRGVPRNTQGIDRSVLRGRSQRLHSRSQGRRNAIKHAHDACSNLAAGGRLQCLQRVRDNTLD